MLEQAILNIVIVLKHFISINLRNNIKHELNKLCSSQAYILENIQSYLLKI